MMLGISNPQVTYIEKISGKSAPGNIPAVEPRKKLNLLSGCAIWTGKKYTESVI